MNRLTDSNAVIQFLNEHGFVFVARRGNHQKFRSATGRTAIVPHPQEALPTGTVRSILRKSGLHAEPGF